MNIPIEILAPLGFLPNLGPMEMIIVLVVVLLIFGPKKLPELFRSFGKSIKEFKKASSEIEDDIRTAMDSEPEIKQSSTKEKELDLKGDDK
jgi:sec-independent protein translocase protein TatA